MPLHTILQGVLTEYMMELEGRLPGNTLCGRSFSKASLVIPFLESSTLTWPVRYREAFPVLGHSKGKISLHKPYVMYYIIKFIIVSVRVTLNAGYTHPRLCPSSTPQFVQRNWTKGSRIAALCCFGCAEGLKSLPRSTWCPGGVADKRRVARSSLVRPKRSVPWSC